MRFSAADYVGNMNYTDVSADVDNTKPELITIRLRDNQIGELTRIGDTFYMSKNSTDLDITISHYEVHLPTTNTIYVNGTAYSFSNETWLGNINITGSNYLIINNITIIDGAYPRNNTVVIGLFYIERDLTPPSAPTYASMEKVCGGIILEGINATDNIAVGSYRVSINGDITFMVYMDNLTSTILTRDPNKTWFALDNKLILNLIGYSTVNFSITTIDYALNEKSGDTIVTSVPKGRWYPIELQPKWNMISLPLIPNSTLATDIYSLILKQGMSGVVVTYAYDHYLDRWD